jgi:hypothetical protein
MKASAHNTAPNTTLNAPQGVDPAARLLIALMLWSACGAAAAGSVIGTHISAAAPTRPVTKPLRPVRSLDLAGRRMPWAASRAQELRFSAQPALRTYSAGDIRLADESAASAAGPISIHWQSKPEIVRVARQLRRNGLPIVRLWQSGPNLLAIGISPHGVPGIYFTQKGPD